MATVKEQVMQIVTDYVDIPAGEIDTATGLKFTAGLDSYAVLSMVAAIEEHFSIHIPDTKLTELKTLDDIISYVESVA